jgi:hypothetical protein
MPSAKEIFSLATLGTRAIGLAALIFILSFSTTPHLISVTESRMTDRHKRSESFFYVHVTVRSVKFPKIKPTRCTNFSNLFLE